MAQPDKFCGGCKNFMATDEVKGECRRYPPNSMINGVDLLRLIFSWYLMVRKDTPACGEYQE